MARHWRLFFLSRHFYLLRVIHSSRGPWSCIISGPRLHSPTVVPSQAPPKVLWLTFVDYTHWCFSVEFMDSGSLPTFCTLWLTLKPIFTFFFFAIILWRTKSLLLCAFFLFLRSHFNLRKCWWSCRGWASLRKNTQTFRYWSFLNKNKFRFAIMPIKMWFLIFSITARI